MRRAGRYVVLLHDHPASHYDWMLEAEGVLATWRVCAPPAAVSAGGLPAERLADHRLAYLDYEGPVSGGRGTVRRVEAGMYEAEIEGDRWIVQLASSVFRLDRCTVARVNPGVGKRTVPVNLHTPKDPFPAKIVEKVKACDKKSPYFTWHIVYDVTGAKFAGKWLAGQSLGILPPGTDENGKPHKIRLYSIASSKFGEDGEGRRVALLIKRVIDEHWHRPGLFHGVCSNYACDQQVGDTTLLTGPSGNRFVLPEDANAHRYVFLATGTGIAPFRAMLKELEGVGYTGAPPWLIFGSPYSTDLFYDDYFRDLERKGRLIYRTAVSREGKTKSGKRPYVVERMREAADELGPVLCDPSTLVYVCGLKGMEIGIYQAIAEQAPDLIESMPEGLAAGADDRDPRWERVKMKRDRAFIEVY